MLTLDEKELLKFLDDSKIVVATIEVVDDPAELYTTPRAQRPKRKSKVVETILDGREAT